MIDWYITKKNSWETRPSGGKRAPNPSAGNSLSLKAEGMAD